MNQSIALTWRLSTLSGYGVYGIQIVLQALRRKVDKIILTRRAGVIDLPSEQQALLDPVVAFGNQVADMLAQHPDQMLNLDHAVLQPVGNNFSGMEGQGRVLGNPMIGCAAIEHKECSAIGRKVGKLYTKLIAISRWNENFLKELDVAPVHLCYQGIDSKLFSPKPPTGNWPGRFVVFSGGKFEFRKGQDIVAAAFKIFQARHKDALLVTAWQNLLPVDPSPYILAGHCQDIPKVENETLQVALWLAVMGLPPESFVNLPFVHNMMMPAILADCDIALFPNRAEGGTNLVAMEAMACGVPTYVADNTGQKDLIELFGCGALHAQNKVKTSANMMSVEDWGETDVDEVVAAMESVYANREIAKTEALKVSEKARGFDWPAVNDKLLDVVFAP